MKSVDVRVFLIKHTPDPEKTIAVAARMCYAPIGAEKLFKEFSDEKAEKLLRAILKSGHYSAVEHASFTFAIEGISRACTHQLVRHRLASFNQQSQRYVSLLKDRRYIVPPKIKKSNFSKEYLSYIKSCWDMYEKMLDGGIEPEDARYILPQAVETKIIVSMNARELLHFFSLRCCRRAQWEIRKLAYLMNKEVLEVAPILFNKSGPNCLRGPCREHKFSCGKPLKDIKELEDDEDFTF